MLPCRYLPCGQNIPGSEPNTSGRGLALRRRAVGGIDGRAARVALCPGSPRDNFLVRMELNMSGPNLVRAIVAALILWLAGELQAQTPREKFLQAYYLEHARGDCAAAAGLYAEAVKTAGADQDLRAEAAAGLAACREELATADFARLMPPNPLAYVELNRPGERIGKLLDQLGLLAKPGEANGNRLAISPELIHALLGMRGAAAAMTGFDPAAQRPSGVVVFHPGDVELVRGIIETALPAGCKPAPAIGGFVTYEAEGVLVTLTSRLVIVGTSAGEIAGVLERMRGEGEDSLATDPELAEVLKERDGALLFFCVNPKPILPLVNGMMAVGAMQCREAALARRCLIRRAFGL